MTTKSTESLDEIWSGDLLDRRIDAKLLQDFLIARHEERSSSNVSGSYVLNLNAAWGYGKTFFIRRLARQLASSGYLVSYVNAWEDDAGREPLVAVMAAIEEAVRPHLGKRGAVQKYWRAAKKSGGEALLAVTKGMAKRVITKTIGDGVEEVIEIFHDAEVDTSALETVTGKPKSKKVNEPEDTKIAEEAAETITTIADRLMTERLASFRRRTNSVKAFKVSMARLLASLGEKGSLNLPMFVFIDELDRCRPTYSIEMIEQVKHLFDIESIVFVIASDTHQLSKSISAVYGQEFDGKRYLLRFFNRQYAFEVPNIDRFCEFIFSKSNIPVSKISTPLDVAPHIYFAQGCQAFNLTLRDVEQVFDIFRNFITTWDVKYSIELAYLLPLIIYFQQGDFLSFAHGSKFEGDNASESPNNWMMYYRFSDQNMQYQESSISGMRIFNLIRNRLSQSLPKITSSSPKTNDTIQYWIYQRFANELQILHQGRWMQGGEPQSVLMSYARRVQSLARLTAPQQ